MARISELENNLITVALEDLSQSTVQVQLNVTSGDGGAVLVQRAVGIAYADSNGVWRFKGNIGIETVGGARNQIVGAIAGILTPPESEVTFQSFSAYPNDPGVSNPFTQINRFASNNNEFEAAHNAAISLLWMDFDIELAGQPTDAFVSGDDRFDTFQEALEGRASAAGSVDIGTAFVAGILKKNPTVIRGNSTRYDIGGTVQDVLILNAVPQGTYRVTIGALHIYNPNDDHGWIEPQLNDSSIPYGVNVWQVGNTDDVGALFNSYRLAPSSVRIVTFPRADIGGAGQNTFSIDIVIEQGSVIQSPEYILEKLENYEEITDEWD